MTPDEVIERFEHETPMGLKPEDGVRHSELTREEIGVLVREVLYLRRNRDSWMAECKAAWYRLRELGEYPS